MIDGRMLLVVERISFTTKIYGITLDRAAPAQCSLVDPATRPTLEQMSNWELRDAGIPVLDKELVLSTDDHPGICGDLEGMILLDAKTLLLSNDSDFRIEGAQTQFWLVPLER